MYAHVSSQMALLRKRFITLSAFERLLASMYAKMSRQIDGTRTRFIARATHVWTLASMYAKMNCQTALLIKRSIALSAFERLLASMYKIVSCQISSTRKIFIADFTDMCSSPSSSCSALTKISSSWNCQTDRSIHFLLFSSSLAL